MSILSGAPQYANADSLNQGIPYNNVDGKLVNIDSSSYSGGFGSNETSLQYGLPSIRNNVLAADASRIMSGGAKKSKTLRRKIKNITNKYRMPKTKRNAIKRRLSRKYGRRTGKKRTIRRSRVNKRLICHKKHHHTKKCYRRVKSSRRQRGGYYDHIPMISQTLPDMLQEAFYLQMSLCLQTPYLSISSPILPTA